MAIDSMYEIDSDIVDTSDVLDALNHQRTLKDIEGEAGEVDAELLEALEALYAACEDSGLYLGDLAANGEALIADHYFEEYAEQLAEDIGAIGSSNLAWPLNYIDWPAAAKALRQDYTEVTWDGSDWWVRA